MALLENIALALTSLRANKMRALFTMLGIIIGIGAVLAIVTIGDSMAGAMRQEMASFGARNVTVSVQSRSLYSMGQMGMDEMMSESSVLNNTAQDYTEPEPKDFITPAMLADYEKKFSGQLEAVAVSEQFGNTTVTNGRRKAAVALQGTTVGQQVMENIQLRAGRFLKEQDLSEQRLVAVVSDKFIDRWGGGRLSYEDAIGTSFATELSGRPVRLYICGVYTYVRPDMGYQTQKNGEIETNVYLPVTAAKRVTQTAEGYRTLTLRPAHEADAAAFLKDTNAFFASYYTRNKNVTAVATSMESMVKSMNEMMQKEKMAISAIAAISLLVGGIGVMNIMMVSVTERTREIGVRMALGAKGKVIRFQFIVEAVIICMIGGLIGVVLGLILGSVGASMMHYAARPSLVATVGSVAFSMFIGVFFGYYPANRASKLDPIEALRYE